MKFTRLFFAFLIIFIFYHKMDLHAQSPKDPPGSVFSSSQLHLRFQHIRAEDGLLQRDIWAILQDSQGFLWLGTSEGLVRYDGYYFKTFARQPFDSTTLSHNHIRCLHEDSRGWLWIGTADGLNCFSRDTERFWWISILPESLNTTTAATIYSINEDSSGALWIGSSKGLSCLTFSNDVNTSPESFSYPWRCKTIPIHQTHILVDSHDIKSFKNTVYSILIDRQGILWVGTAAGLYWHINDSCRMSTMAAKSPKSFTFQKISGDDANPDDLLNNDILQLHEDRSGTIWAVTKGGLTCIDPPHIDQKRSINRNSYKVRSLKFKDYPTKDLPIFTKAILELPGDNGSKLWIGLDGNGFVVFDPQSETYRPYQAEFDRHFNPLIPYTVLSFYKDYSDIIWVGSGGGALHKYDPYANRFSNYHPSLEKIPLNSLIDLRFVFQDSRGDLWIAEEMGYHCNRHSGEIKSIFW